jgi:hypothetical protein
LTDISLKGIWFKSIQTLYPELKEMTNLEKIDIGGSKYLFTDGHLDSFVIFKHLSQLKILDLSDSRMRTENLELLLKSFNQKVVNSLQELNLMKNMLDPHSFDVLAQNYEKIISLKILNLAFNPQIGNKGFSTYTENCEKFNFSQIDLRGCGVFLKSAFNPFINFLFKKEHSITKMDFYYNSFKDMDFESFVKTVHKFVISNSDSISKAVINMKIFFKFKYNADIHKKLENELEFLYKKYNLVLR